MLCKSQQGYLLITDRYPQVECRVFALMARNWQKPRAVTVDKNVKAARAEAVPMDGVLFAVLLIRLGIDEQTAFARKPDPNWRRYRKKSPLRRN